MLNHGNEKHQPAREPANRDQAPVPRDFTRAVGAQRDCTENISRSGILLAWRGEGEALPPPAVGQIVTVEVELPANHGFGQKCIHCQGTVMRVAETEGDVRGWRCK